jgi:hypothetical protein
MGKRKVLPNEIFSYESLRINSSGLSLFMALWFHCGIKWDWKTLPPDSLE